MSSREVTYERISRAFLKEGAWLQFSSPVFSTLLRASADDVHMLDLASAVRPGQPVGLLFPIVAHYLLLKSPQAQLARYFPSLTVAPAPLDEAFPVFREFCLDQRREFAELLSWRTVNTNLVERASCILPALAHVAQLTGEPLRLVEICCSSGVNLLIDQYHYDYGVRGSIGVAGSAVQLRCQGIGPVPPPVTSMPEIVERVGIDLVPMDVSDPLECLWMEAALCPEWSGEREHLRAALGVRAAHSGRIIKGDALRALPQILDELPGSVCVLHSYCMGQWSEPAKSQLDEVLRAASRYRDIHRLAIDMPEKEAPEWIRSRLAALAGAGISLSRKSFPSRIEHTWYVQGSGRNQLLGQADGFGGWIFWHALDARRDAA